MKKTLHVLKIVIDFSGLFSGLFFVLVLLHELYIGGSRHGGMALALFFWTYVGLFVPYYVGRFLSRF